MNVSNGSAKMGFRNRVEERLQLGASTFGHQLYGPIRLIHDIAGDREVGGEAVYGIAEPNPLNVAGEANLDASLRHHVLLNTQQCGSNHQVIRRPDLHIVG